MVKILHLTHSLPSAKYPLVIHIIEALKEIDGVEVVECYLYRDRPDWYQGNGLFLNINRNGLSFVRELRAILEICRDQKVNFIFTQRYRPALLGSVATRLLSLPSPICIYHGLGEFDGFFKGIQSLLFMRCNTIVGVADMVKNDILKSSKWIPEDHVNTIYNGIDVSALHDSLLSREEARRQLGLPRNCFVIGSMGRCVRKKGFDLLIQAFSQLAANHEDRRLMIVGDGPELASLRRLSADNSRIHFAGFRPQASRYLRAFDLMVMPSRSEGLSLSALEACLAKVPLVTSNAGGLPEVLGSEGIFCQVDDVYSLQFAIEKFLALNEMERVSYAQKICQRAEVKFTHTRMKAAYQSLVKSRIALLSNPSD